MNMFTSTSHIVAIASPLEGPEGFRRTTVIVEHREGDAVAWLTAHRWDTEGKVHGPAIDLRAAVENGKAAMLHRPVAATPCVAWVMRPNFDHPGEYGRKHLRVTLRKQMQPISDEKHGDHFVMLTSEPQSRDIRFEFASKLAALAVKQIEVSIHDQAKWMLDRAIELCPNKERKAEYQALRAGTI